MNIVGLNYRDKYQRIRHQECGSLARKFEALGMPLLPPYFTIFGSPLLARVYERILKAKLARRALVLEQGTKLATVSYRELLALLFYMSSMGGNST